jgi:hypothetical protein
MNLVNTYDPGQMLNFRTPISGKKNDLPGTMLRDKMADEGTALDAWLVMKAKERGKLGVDKDKAF